MRKGFYLWVVLAVSSLWAGPDDPVVLWGVAATSDHLHLGSYASLKVLQKYEQQGYQIALLIDDQSAGLDPSGSPGNVGMLSPAQQKENAEKLLPFLQEILGPDAVIYYTSDLKISVNFPQLLQETGRFQVTPGSLSENLYPYSDAYNYRALAQKIGAKNVLLLGGEDQFRNLAVGQEVLTSRGISSAFVLHPLLIDPQTGQKMGKRGLNPVFLDDPEAISRYMESLPDGDLKQVWDLLGNGAMPPPQEVRRALSEQLQSVSMGLEQKRIPGHPTRPVEKLPKKEENGREPQRKALPQANHG